jgi:phenylpropionate dioxygenase-like ring-hydroxylating dioxygenase large terminal subunit
MNSPNFLTNIWYYGIPSGNLKPGQMLAKQILDRPIVFGRTMEGTAFALRDICPHRGIPLSCGRIEGGEIECAYHGWRFDRSGSCTQIPALPLDRSMDLSKFGVFRYPITESQGNIWIYLPTEERGEVIPTEPAPVVPGFGETEVPQAIVTMTFPCLIDHAIIGLMDPAHVPFVHRAWWWRNTPELTDEIKAFDPSPYGFTMRRHLLERQTFFYRLIGGDAEVEISFRLPGVRVEQVITKTNHLSNLTVLTPISATETEVSTMFYTTLGWIPALKPILLPFVRTFLNQDRDMVVKQQIGLQYDPPLMLIPDADAQAKWYYQLRSEYTKADREQREFINPVKSQVLHWRS